MKISRREQTKAITFYIIIWIFFTGFGMISTSVTHWKKFNFEEESVEPGCPPENARFIKVGVPDHVTCGRLCFEDDACESALYRQEDHLCIGCQYFNRYLPSNAQMGFVHYSTRKIEVDCLDILEQNETAESGVYEVIFRELETVHVYCDMTTDGGGWTVFQNRFNGSVDFTKTFSDYENGFGDLNGEFWLGLKFVQELTRKPSFLKLEVTMDTGLKMFDRISDFKLLGSQYKLLATATTTTGSVIEEAVGANFTTIYRDSAIPCVSEYGGGWWYPDIDCDLYLNMNGMYGKTAGKYKGKMTKSIMMFKRM